jgi:hypothetical protein
MEISRPDEKTLVIRPEGGFFAVPGRWKPDPEVERLLFDLRSAWPSLDRLYCDPTPMTEGQRINLVNATVEITAVHPDGRPAEAAFRFHTKLENPFFIWMEWKEGAFAPFTLPRVGETVKIPGVTYPFEG